MKQMARPVWDDHRLDVDRRERLNQIVGTLGLFVILIAVCLLSGGPQ